MIVPVNELQIGNISSMAGSDGRPICKFDFLGGGLTRCFLIRNHFICNLVLDSQKI